MNGALGLSFDDRHRDAVTTLREALLRQVASRCRDASRVPPRGRGRRHGDRYCQRATGVPPCPASGAPLQSRPRAAPPRPSAS